MVHSTYGRLRASWPSCEQYSIQAPRRASFLYIGLCIMNGGVSMEAVQVCCSASAGSGAAVSGCRAAS